MALPCFSYIQVDGNNHHTKEMQIDMKLVKISPKTLILTEEKAYNEIQLLT